MLKEAQGKYGVNNVWISDARESCCTKTNIFNGSCETLWQNFVLKKSLSSKKNVEFCDSCFKNYFIFPLEFFIGNAPLRKFHFLNSFHFFSYKSLQHINFYKIANFHPRTLILDFMLSCHVQVWEWIYTL